MKVALTIGGWKKAEQVLSGMVGECKKGSKKDSYLVRDFKRISQAVASSKIDDSGYKSLRLKKTTVRLLLNKSLVPDRIIAPGVEEAVKYLSKALGFVFEIRTGGVMVDGNDFWTNEELMEEYEEHKGGDEECRTQDQ